MTTTSLDYYVIEELLTDDERAARDRARLGSRRHGNPSKTRRRSLCFEWRQVLDRQRVHRGREGHLDKGRRRQRRRICRGKGYPRISCAGYRGKIQPAHVAHVGVLVRKLPDSGGEPPAQSIRTACAAIVSLAGACGRGVGCDWRGHRLLRNGARLRQIASTIWPPDCRLPA